MITIVVQTAIDKVILRKYNLFNLYNSDNITVKLRQILPYDMKEIDFNSQFQHALHLLSDSAQHLFITGKAGTGKSTLLNHACKTICKNFVVLAPTGVAALNVGGQTIHRFFNFSIDITPDKATTLRPRKKALYNQLETIIIDEASMLRADLLDCMNHFLQQHGPKPQQLFGGVQMVFVGDLFQLPPVVSRQEHVLFAEHYQTPYFFSAHAFSQIDLTIIELTQIYRQRDQQFVALLNAIRNNRASAEDLQQLNQRHSQQMDNHAIYLTTTNQQADDINQSQLSQLSNELYEAQATIIGKVGPEYYPNKEIIHYKIGAQIMLLNNDAQARWVNGSIGEVIAVDEDDDGETYLRIRLQGQKTSVKVYAFTWEVFQFSLKGKQIVSELIGSFTQLPIRLAWAVTIHKSQGKTFDKVNIDMSRGSFASGQLYVALSRCTSLDGVTLKTPISAYHIKSDTRITQFLRNYYQQKAEQHMPLAQRIARLQQAIDDKKPLSISYMKADSSQHQWQIIPKQILQRNHNQHHYQSLHAYCIERDQDRIFRLDRILQVN